MFASNVTALLKPNSISRFGLLIKQQVIPMLRNQNGFQDVRTFFAPGGEAVKAISWRDSSSNAEIYSRATYHIPVLSITAYSRHIQEGISSARAKNYSLRISVAAPSEKLGAKNFAVVSSGS